MTRPAQVPLHGPWAQWWQSTDALLLSLAADDRVVDLNPAFERWCAAPLRMKGPWWPSCPAYALAALQAAVDGARRGEAGAAVVTHPDRERCWTFRVTSAAGGQVVLEGHQGAAAQRLLEQLRWWESCFEQLPVALTFYDPKGRQRFGNRAYRRLVSSLGRPLSGSGAGVDHDVGRAESVLLNPGASARELTLRSCPVQRDGTWSGDVVIVQDVTRHRSLERRLTYQATHDPLTGLLNRSALESEPAHLATRALTTALFIDLDDFKRINDTWGHAAGDVILQVTACRLTRWQRAGDLVVRWGGDEFVALIRAVTPAQAQVRAEDLLDALRPPIRVGAQQCSVGVSIGVAFADPRRARVADLLAQADAAMYAAKRAGKNRIQLHRARQPHEQPDPAPARNGGPADPVTPGGDGRTE